MAKQKSAVRMAFGIVTNKTSFLILSSAMLKKMEHLENEASTLKLQKS